jgi:phage anti-repressor protein
MSEINIIELIEKNQITQLSKTYNNKLLVKVKEIFTESQQKLFISSFYCYLNYSQTNDFSIDLDNIWKWLGFTQKISAKIVLEKNFKSEIDYKILSKEHQSKSHGGHNKETIMLNIKTFKLFCLKAGTKKANEIHEYFIKLEELLQQTIGEECAELKTQLKKIEENNEKDRDIQNKKNREKLLLREFGSKGSIVYIIKVKSFENGQYIVKIGESRRGIQGRYAEHKTNYKDIILLDCFKTSNSKDFEYFLHQHPLIKPNRVNNLPGHEQELELFLIGKELSYDLLLQIINENINNYNDTPIDNLVEKLYNEIHTLKQRLESKCLSDGIDSSTTNIIMEPHILQKILENQIEMSKQIQSLEKSNKEILDTLTTSQTKTTTNFNQPLVTISHKLQQINPETMTIIKVYETVAQCLVEHNYRMKRPSIEKAIKENRIYNGFLWAYVDREKDPNIIHNPIQINPSRPQNNGYIAKVNKHQTEIIAVYLDRKTAAIQNGYKSTSALDNTVKNKTLANDHYYILYDKCEKNLIRKFIEKNGEPILYKYGVGYFDVNKNLKHEFVCKYDCIKQLKISDKTLAKVLDNDVLYNNHYFMTLPEKLCIHPE